MVLALHWQQIALRLAMAAVASFLIGLNRDERGHPAGIRTTMLVCLAATLAMLQVNLMLPMSGKTSSSFAVMDLMRNPLGILSGIGFLGAGVIMKRDTGVTGVTTAATMWFVTVLGLLFGGGQLVLASTGSGMGLVVLWGLKYVEKALPREQSARLRLTLGEGAPKEHELRELVRAAGWRIAVWNATFEPPSMLSKLECTLRWEERAGRPPRVPEAVDRLRSLPGVLSVSWQE
jgi:putative Mg2+ transporter-C (MgtC) family protein